MNDKLLALGMVVVISTLSSLIVFKKIVRRWFTSELFSLVIDSLEITIFYNNIYDSLYLGFVLLVFFDR
jgi:hypothetical protein